MSAFETWLKRWDVPKQRRFVGPTEGGKNPSTSSTPSSQPRMRGMAPMRGAVQKTPGFPKSSVQMKAKL